MCDSFRSAFLSTLAMQFENRYDLVLQRWMRTGLLLRFSANLRLHKTSSWLGHVFEPLNNRMLVFANKIQGILDKKKQPRVYLIWDSFRRCKIFLHRRFRKEMSFTKDDVAPLPDYIILSQETGDFPQPRRGNIFRPFRNLRYAMPSKRVPCTISCWCRFR